MNKDILCMLKKRVSNSGQWFYYIEITLGQNYKKEIGLSPAEVALIYDKLESI